MTSDDIWILGINMTKFGKHPDKDTVDLAAEAAMAALADGGVTMADMGVLAAGNLMGGRRASASSSRSRSARPASRCTTWPTRAPPAPPRCARRSWRSRPASADMGLAVGVEKLAGAGLLGGGGKPKQDGNTWEPKGRYGAVAGTDGRIGTDTMPGVFAQVGMEYGHKYGGADFELFAKISEKNHAHSTLNPLAAYQKRIHARRDHGRHDDRLPEHAADVLGQLRRRGRGRGGPASQAEDAVARAAAPRRSRCRRRCSRPTRSEDGVPGPARTSTRSPATPPSRRTSRPASAPRTSTWSSCTTASPRPSSCTTTT